MLLVATLDPWILAFSLATVAATIWMGFWSARRSKSASDFFVAGRSVSVGWNASAISGEYLSAASFMGVAGMVMSSGYDALWYPVCYACGYLFLLLFIAGPLRRFGAYTIPDFAEGRYDSPVFRKIAVVFVLFIGFFYTMPQMKGAGTTLAYIFPGLPYWVGVVLVGAVITLNVALGGMKGITLVQAFQYWAKMFAISVPVFVLMSMYGHYGKQLGVNGGTQPERSETQGSTNAAITVFVQKLETAKRVKTGGVAVRKEFSLSQATDFESIKREASFHGLSFALKNALGTEYREVTRMMTGDPESVFVMLSFLGGFGEILWVDSWTNFPVKLPPSAKNMPGGLVVVPRDEAVKAAIDSLESSGACLLPAGTNRWLVAKISEASEYGGALRQLHWIPSVEEYRKPLPTKAPADSTWLNPFGPDLVEGAELYETLAGDQTGSLDLTLPWLDRRRRWNFTAGGTQAPLWSTAEGYAEESRKRLLIPSPFVSARLDRTPLTTNVNRAELAGFFLNELTASGYGLVPFDSERLIVVRGAPAEISSWSKAGELSRKFRLEAIPSKPITVSSNTPWQDRRASYRLVAFAGPELRHSLPAKAPADAAWLNPFGPLTTKAAKAAKPEITYAGDMVRVGVWTMDWPLNERLGFAWHVLRHSPATNMLLGLGNNRVAALDTYWFAYRSSTPLRALEDSELWVAKDLMDVSQTLTNAPTVERMNSQQGMDALKDCLTDNGITVIESGGIVKAFPTKDAVITPVDPKPYALLYTYSLIMALVCGTAGLPHILVRFYTNPNGVAAKRTTMWVMILIGVFYLFPPIFGVLGRNLMPSLYEGTGAKGTDKVVLELPRVLNAEAAENGKTGKRENETDTSAPTVPSSRFPVFPSSTTVGATDAGNAGKPEKAIDASPASVPSSRLPVFPSSPQPAAAGRNFPWGSLLSGITCAGAFAAFMSTFSGLLVSMTGALAHDVYGRMLKPNSTPAERLRMFKWCAVTVGTVAVVLGCFVEPLQINFMVGQAFAIAAASYFPLLFMSVWWRGMTMKGAAIGMLAGGVCALVAVTLTNFSDLSAVPKPGWFAHFAGLTEFWKLHPLLRILCEQPAIWTVPLAIGLMVVVSKFTRRTVPADVRMKMLVLHAPEELGLKQEYIREHEGAGQPH